MATERLTDLAARKAQPKDKDYKLSDGKGMYLLVKPNGSKYWRMKFRFANKEKTLALGVYPEISLEKARSKLREGRDLLDSGIDPSLARKREKLTQEHQSHNTFELVARSWVEKKAYQWSKNHADDVLKSFVSNVFPKLGNVPIADIDSALLRPVLETIQARGALEATKRVRQRCSGVFRYGQALGLCSSDPAEPLKEILIHPPKRNFAALSLEEMPDFLFKLNKYNCLMISGKKKRHPKMPL